jgi:hypothetical protein
MPQNGAAALCKLYDKQVDMDMARSKDLALKHAKYVNASDQH